MKQFAPNYPRNEYGWVKFPSDISYRKELFPEGVNLHQAKANVYLVQAIAEYVSEPGQTLLDPFGGTGTLMVAAIDYRNVTLIEISDKFHRLQLEAVDKLAELYSGIEEHISLIHAPLQKILPIPNFAHHIIFSPPYADILKGTNKSRSQLTKDRQSYDIDEYTHTSPLNLGLMSEFLWKHEMSKVYKKCYDTLNPGGSMTIIIKDHIEAGNRVAMTQMAVDMCMIVGFSQDPKEWFKWAAPGSLYTKIYRSRGMETVDDEDIVVMRKV